MCCCLNRSDFARGQKTPIFINYFWNIGTKRALLVNQESSVTLNYIVKNLFRYTKPFAVLLFTLITSAAFAQKLTPEELRQQEQQKKAMLYQLLDSGVYYMNHGKYDVADKKFIYVLNNIRSVPSDLTFYFGKKDRKSVV